MKTGLLALPLVLFASCAPATRTAPVPDAGMAARSRVSSHTLQRGYGVYMAQCGRCHEHILPADVSKEDWHVVVPGMAWNAGISKADEKALTAYLTAAVR